MPKTLYKDRDVFAKLFFGAKTTQEQLYAATDDDAFARHFLNWLFERVQKNVRP